MRMAFLPPLKVFPLHSRPILRSFSAGKPRVVLHGIDGRYATALYEVASAGELSKIVKEMQAVKTKINSDKSLSATLEAPIFSNEEKNEAMIKSLGINNLSPTSKNFFNLLSENKRLNHLQKILDSFQKLVSSHNDEVCIEIVSSRKLDDSVINRIVTSSKNIKGFCHGSNIVVKTEIDPSILGGFIVKADDKCIDLSVSTKVAQINKILNEAI